LTPGGVWDSNKIEVAALLKKNGKSVGVLPLHYAGSPSQFSAVWKLQDAGTYEAVVYTYDPGNGNTGMDSVTVNLR
jgi:hypothetical protein